MAEQGDNDGPPTESSSTMSPDSGFFGEEEYDTAGTSPETENNNHVPGHSSAPGPSPATNNSCLPTYVAARPSLAAQNSNLFPLYTAVDGTRYHLLPVVRDPTIMEAGELIYRSWIHQPFGQNLVRNDHLDNNNTDSENERVTLPSFKIFVAEVEAMGRVPIEQHLIANNELPNGTS